MKILYGLSLNMSTRECSSPNQKELIVIFRPYFIWERKRLNQTGFLNKNGQARNLYLTLRVLPLEFNSHKFSFVRFVFVEVSGLF